MMAPTGRNRVPPEPEQAPNNVQPQPHGNHRAPAAAIAAAANEISLEGMSVKDELDILDKKIKATIDSEDKTVAHLRKLARDRAFLEQAALTEEVEPHLE